MADIVDKSTRSRMMAGIGTKDTNPEIVIRKSLYARGYRYRKNVITLAGSPDIVLKKHAAVIQIYGCFWHGHDCNNFKWPTTRPDFWKTKIMGNQSRDRFSEQRLISDGWRLLIVWECVIKKAVSGSKLYNLDSLISQIISWIETGSNGITHIGGDGLAE